jgi:hypothetical protein
VTQLKRLAYWEAGCTCKAANIWRRYTAEPGGEGWLLVRWKGLDLDLGPIIHACVLPNGETSGFAHPHNPEMKWVWGLLNGATWWSSKVAPPWLLEAGVAYPADIFTQQRILDDVAQDGRSGFGRKRLPHWPEPIVEVPE